VQVLSHKPADMKEVSKRIREEISALGPCLQRNGSLIAGPPYQ
jgi:hypothetical protein